jgi:hypothetical protein
MRVCPKASLLSPGGEVNGGHLADDDQLAQAGMVGQGVGAAGDLVRHHDKLPQVDAPRGHVSDVEHRLGSGFHQGEKLLGEGRHIRRGLPLRGSDSEDDRLTGEHLKSEVRHRYVLYSEVSSMLLIVADFTIREAYRSVMWMERSGGACRTARSVEA